MRHFFGVAQQSDEILYVDFEVLMHLHELLAQKEKPSTSSPERPTNSADFSLFSSVNCQILLSLCQGNGSKEQKRFSRAINIIE